MTSIVEFFNEGTGGQVLVILQAWAILPFVLHYSVQLIYSELTIIRLGRSRLVEFEKKDNTGCLIETFSKYSDQVV